MINVNFYGVDPYLLRGVSKDLTEKIANLCEVKKEDVLFMSSDGLLCNDGVEQDDWYALIYVDLPSQLEPLEKKFVDLLKNHLDKVTLHFEVIFRYYHLHSRYLSINKDYPIFVTERNSVYTEIDESSSYETSGESGHEHHEHSDEEIYIGNAFEGFEEKIKKD